MGGLAPGAHWGSVLAAYGVTAAILLALVWASVVEARRARRDLEGLEPERPERAGGKDRR